MRKKESLKKINRKRIIFVILLCLAGPMTLTACKVSGNDPSETTDALIFTAETSVVEIEKTSTETAAAITAATTTSTTKATLQVTVTSTPTVKETTSATTAKAAETTATAVATKATAAPAATTKAPVAATDAPPVETAAPPVETTAAPATDYTAVCAEIRSKLISILEANGQWDPNFTGTITGWGQKWWGVGWYDDGDMTTQDFADEYYNGKFSMSVGVEIACGIDCYVADNKIYLDYRSFTPT